MENQSQLANAMICLSYGLHFLLVPIMTVDLIASNLYYFALRSKMLDVSMCLPIVETQVLQTLVWVDPAPTQLLVHASCSGVGDTTGRTKASKCLGQGKDSSKVKERGKRESAALAIFHNQTSQTLNNGYAGRCSIPYPKIFISEHEATQYGISLQPVCVSCPASVPSQILAHPQSGKQESFDVVQALFSSSQNHWGVKQRCSSHRLRTQQGMVPCEESELHFSQSLYNTFGYSLSK